VPVQLQVLPVFRKGSEHAGLQQPAMRAAAAKLAQGMHAMQRNVYAMQRHVHDMQRNVHAM
jgi:hypothetical protein